MLSKKIIIITGSSKGIGKEIARKFLRYNTNFLILNSRNENEFIKNTKKNHNIKFFKGDISKLKNINKIKAFLRKKKLKIDGIVCNVGGGSNPKNGEENIKNYEVNFQKNFFSSINIIYGLKKLFKKNAKIVCISSIASKSIVDTPIAYSVAKAALNSFVVNFAKNFKINKICITGILPGHVMHQNSVWMKKKKINPKLVNLLIDRHIPSGEWIKPKDISELTYFLLSHSSNSFNGTLIDLEGGVTTK